MFRRPDMQERAAGFLDSVYDDLPDDDVRALHALVGRWLALLGPAPPANDLQE